jgi:hypothetical protein
MFAIKLVRFGEFKEEWVSFFLSEYEERVQRFGEPYARRWAHLYAAKTVFYAALEWAKLVMTIAEMVIMIYRKLAGR